MSKSSFCHLHIHSEYSLLEGTCSPAAIAAAAAAAGQEYAALTDSGVMFGCAEFIEACEKAGVKPVTGCEIRLEPVGGGGARSGAPAGFRTGRRYYRLVLLCENAEGYRNLSYIGAHLETDRGERYVPASLLAERAGGLIALSGGRGGEIFEALCAGDVDRAGRAAGFFTGVFGKDSFFVELTDHKDGTERQLIPSLCALAKGAGVGVVATNDVRYTGRDGAELQTALACIREGRTVDSGPGLPTGEYYMKSTAEMEDLFGHIPDALSNSVKIAQRCSLPPLYGGRHLPSFPLPAGETAPERLRKDTEAGIGRLFASGRIPAEGHTPEEYTERAEYELSVIRSTGFDDYFLIVADYVAHAKSTGLPVGPGRGSGCGSLVAFATGITDVDPLRYGLFFERFLNPERVSMPDIDIDFDYTRRNEMIDYVTEKYGADRVCHIVTFVRLAAKAALRDAARICGLDAADADRLCSLLPSGDTVSLSSEETGKALRGELESHPGSARAFGYAKMIEGLPRSMSVHPAGVVITDRPASEYLPVLRDGGMTLTQYDMDTVAKLGLLKFDFLALRNLTVINDTEEAVGRFLPGFRAADADLLDPQTYALISRGRTAGIFQLESEGLRRTVMRFRPRCIEDLAAAIALYRPGPMDSIPKYLEGRADPSSVKYPHPLLEPVLRETYGCIVYQEQVMSVFRILAGYSAGRADIVRRAMSKKKAAALEAERSDFIAGAAERGLSPSDAGAIFDDMSSFAGYAFNKSHAVAYALLTFRTAYLKAHYPGEYAAALMNSVIGSPDKTALYAGEAAESGIALGRPDINSGGAMFVYDREKRTVVFGLCAVKGVGVQLAEAVAARRPEGGYRSIGALISAIEDLSPGRRALEGIIRSGAADSTGLPRSELEASLDAELRRVTELRRGGIDGQMDIFSEMPGAGENGVETRKTLPEYPADALRRMEKEYTGFTFAPDVPAAPRGDADARGCADTPGTPSAVYVRVPSRDSAVAMKVINLAGIFSGECPFSIYSSDTGEYRREGGVDASAYLISELRRIAGEDNVAVKTKAPANRV